MFGYVTADKPQLRMCEYEAYKSVYCALCKNIKKNYSVFMTATLNYDFTFLALLGFALNQNKCSVEKKHCVCNPFKKCGYCVCDDKIMDGVSAAAMIMVYYKVLDNIQDGGFFKRIGYKLLRLFVKPAFKKASKAYPETARVFKEQIEISNKNEISGCCSIDKSAEPTAKMLSYLFTQLSKDTGEKRILERMGYCMGRWIYLVDAVDDFYEDKKSGSFNPIINAKMDVADVGYTEAMLNVNIDEILKCAQLLEFKRFKDIILNIVCLGMPKTQKRVLNKDGKDEQVEGSV